MLFLIPPIKTGKGPKCPSKAYPCETLCSTLCSTNCKVVFLIIPPH